MRELNGRQVYTRSDLQEKSQLSVSALEKLFRDRATNGHPESSGKEGRSLVWDAEEWDDWFEARQKAMNPDESTLIDFAGIAEEYGVAELRAKQLWDEREANGHPEPVSWQGRRPRWDRDTYARWWNEAGQTLAQLLSESRGATRMT